MKTSIAFKPANRQQDSIVAPREENSGEAGSANAGMGQSRSLDADAGAVVESTESAVSGCARHRRESTLAYLPGILSVRIRCIVQSATQVQMVRSGSS